MRRGVTIRVRADGARTVQVKVCEEDACPHGHWSELSRLVSASGSVEAICAPCRRYYAQELRSLVRTGMLSAFGRERLANLDRSITENERKKRDKS